jgi:hypothetical protein
MPERPYALDDMVDFLAREDLYWKSVINSGRLLSEKKDKHDTAQERHREKRRRLAFFVDREKQVDRKSTQNLSVFDLDSEDSRSEGSGRHHSSFFFFNMWFTHKTPETERDDVDLAFVNKTHTPIVAPSLSSASNGSPKKSRRRKLSLLPEEECMKCHIAKRCQECSLQACKRCCIKTTEPCKQPNHKINKIGARKPYEQTSTGEITPDLSTNNTALTETLLPGILERINTAIAQRQSIFVTYEDLKKHITVAREIKPKRLKQGKEGQQVVAHCQLKNQERTFYLHGIKRIEDHNWLGGMFAFIFFVFLFFFFFEY